MKKLLLLILTVAFLLRAVGLNSYPPGFTPDEASFGYDAYSILETGRDQWGKSFPLTLQSFGDYKSPLYSYVAIPFVAVFGLEKYSVRLANAVVGTLAVYLTYLLAYELFNNRLIFKTKVDPEIGAIIASFLLAISPWHVMMSRGAFEANLTTLLMPAALYFFVKSVERPKYFIYCAFAIGLNVFSYHSAKFVTPILFLTLFVLFRKELTKKFGIHHKISLFILLVFAGLFLLSMRSGSATRVFDVSIFKTALVEASSQRSAAINQGANSYLSRVIYNKYIVGVRHFFANYTTYFSPQFYFSQGPAETTYGMIPGRGVLYWFELPLLLAGFVYFLKNYASKFSWLVVIWYLVGPIPAALSLGPGYAANRAEVVLPSIQIICAVGVVFLSHLNFRFRKQFVYASGSAVVATFFFYFLFDYFVSSPQKMSEGMLYGNYEAAKYLSFGYSQDQIVMSRKLSEPHIYVAFVNRWDPANYQKVTKAWNYKQIGLGWVDQMPEYSLGNYTFKNINYQEYADKRVILVGKPDEFPQSLSLSKVFSYPGGKQSVVVVDTSSQIYAWKN